MTLLRAPLPAAALALLFAVAPPAPPAHAGPERELVVALAPPRPGASPATVALTPAPRLAARCEALGLRFRRTLAQALPPAALAGAAVRSSGAGAGASSDPFDLDPARVWLVEAPDSAAAAAALAVLEADPDIEWAEPNRVRELAAVRAETPFPDDPVFRDGRQWGLHNLGPASPYGGVAGADIHALEAWQLCVGGNGVLLAVADTGIDPAHPDLQATLPDGSPRIVLAANLTGEEPLEAVADSFGHGTPVTGVMAARTNNGAQFDSLGVAGVCGGDGQGNFGCRIVPLKISPGHSGNATSFALAAAVLYATAVGARAVNISYASDGPSRLERTAFYHAIARGCVPVVAAGNRGYLDGTRAQYPAAYAADGLCIQVGASDPWDRRAVFSSYGPGLDLVAPGVNVWTTFMTYPSAAGASYPGFTGNAGGTSYAAPFVAGAVGLLAAARPELTDVDFQHVIRESAGDIGTMGVDQKTGWGRLDAAAALRAVGPGMGIWHDEVAAQTFTPLRLDTLEVREGGLGTLGHWQGRHAATELEVTASVALPDSFLGPVRVWPRVGGTTTVKAGWSLPYFTPWADVTEWDPPRTSLPPAQRTFTLRGYLYRIEDCGECPEEPYVPLPPDQTRFGFTVIGRVDRPPSVALLAPAAGDTLTPGDTVAVRWSATDPDEVTEVEVALVQPGRAPVTLARAPGAVAQVTATVPCGAPGSGVLRVTAFDAHAPRLDQSTAETPVVLRTTSCNGGPGTRLTFAPNPFRDEARFTGPAGRRLAIHDLSGRLVRIVTLDGGGHAVWDGRDRDGRPVRPGIYLVRGLADRVARIVRIE